MNSSTLGRILRYPLILMVGALIFTIGPIIAAQYIANLVPETMGPWANILKACIAAGLCLLGYRTFELYIETRDRSDFDRGGSRWGGAAREWASGVAIGAGLFTLVVGITWALGGYRINGWAYTPSILASGIAMAIVSGIIEEILLRGIIFRFVEAAAGSIIALIFSAGLFGVLHIGNPGASWIAAFAIAIEAGVMLAAVYMITRRLWAVIGLHMAWNFTQGPVFGVPVSGIKDPGFAMSSLQGPDWMTGGAFGLEASVTAMLVATSAGVILLWIAWKQGQFVAAPWNREKPMEGKAATVAP